MSKKRYKTVSQSLRYKILKRDNYTCQGCKIIYSPSLLQVHHVQPFLETRDDRPENLTTLCKPCHETADREHKSVLVKAARARYFERRGVVAKKPIDARVTPEEKARIQAMADNAGLTISEFIRKAIDL